MTEEAVYALNVIEKRDPRQARNLEDSLDFAWARMPEDGGTYYRFVVESILRAAESTSASSSSLSKGGG